MKECSSSRRQQEEMIRYFLFLLCYTTLVIFCTVLVVYRDIVPADTVSPSDAEHGFTRMRTPPVPTGNGSRESPPENATLRSAADGVAGPRTESVTIAPQPSPKYILLDSNQEINLSCHRCALVFSSGHLRGTKLGREIDNTQCVIRQNVAMIRNYARDVGMRTTVRVIGHTNFLRHLVRSPIATSEILYNSRTKASTVYVPWLFKQFVNKTSNDIYTAARKLTKKYPPVKFYFQTDEHISDMDKMFRRETGLDRSEVGSWYSTGFMSVVFAMDVCDKIVFYGLPDAGYCSRHPTSNVRYHYYYEYERRTSRRECDYLNERENLIKGGHKFLTEKVLYAKWAAEHDFTFRAPSWPKSALDLDGANFTSPYLEIFRTAKEDGSFDNFTLSKPKKARRKKVERAVEPPLKPVLRKYTVIRRAPLRGQTKHVSGN